MTRLLAVLSLLVGAFVAASAAAAPLQLERVVIVQRHGVRPPVASNDDLAKYAELPWPAWPVAPGELTPHGGEVVRLMGETLRRAYRKTGLLPADGCPAAGQVQVWADAADQRTRRSGEILAESLAPGCGVKAAWAAGGARDPIFGAYSPPPECKVDPDKAQAAILADAGPRGLDTPATRQALTRLQAILAPHACAGGKGTCFLNQPDSLAAGGFAGARIAGPISDTSSLAEDLLLEYAEGMAAADVGWGRAASAEAIASVMPVHERMFHLVVTNPYVGGHLGAGMAGLVLAALDGHAGAPDHGPALGPAAKIVALAGHDANLSFMAATFGLDWTLPGEPDATAPATTLAFELWRDPADGARYVRPVIYYETLDQMRLLAPGEARRMPLAFQGCADGPGGACPLAELRRRAEAVTPAECRAF